MIGNMIKSIKKELRISTKTKTRINTIINTRMKLVINMILNLAKTRDNIPSLIHLRSLTERNSIGKI